jgi:uncharacterized RDD family membrane protein YckC
MSSTSTIAAGWYHADGDPLGTKRYWDGSHWQGGPRLAKAAVSHSKGSDLGETADTTARAVARIVDLIVWLVISVCVHAALGEPLVRGGSGAKWWIAGLITLVMIGTYEVALPLTRGGTLGKLAMGIGIVSDDGSRLVQESALVRVAPAMLAAIPVFGFYLAVTVALISVPLMFSDKRTQALWDKMAKTLVVKV